MRTELQSNMAQSQRRYELLKSVNSNTKYLIYGYIHEMEKKLKLSTNIPSSIIDVCILFFFIREFLEKCGEDLVIDGGDTLTKISKDAWDNAAFGSKWFESNTNDIIKWTIHVIAAGNDTSCGVNIGIVSKEFGLNESFYRINSSKKYFPFYFNSNGNCIYDNGQFRSNYMKTYGLSNETLTMELNLKKAQLIFYLNEECYGVACDNIVKEDNVKYKFVISLFYCNAKIKLVDFEYNDSG